MPIRCPKCQFENAPDSKFCKNCGTKLHPAQEISITKTMVTPVQELTRGTHFAGRYEIIEELGSGGMGKVYRVLDKEIREEIALKLLRPEIASNVRMIERFKNELKYARKLTHKNVCRMYDINEEDGAYYITMEYVPGEDLKSLINRIGKLTIEKAINITKQICMGLAEAHSFGLVHRDLKPQNIMIDRGGNAHIMDFGVAYSHEGEEITEAGVIIGTPKYMSPEQISGKKADQRSDLYSLGVIIYEMVTGRVPFEGETGISVAVKHRTEAPPDPKKVNSQIPDNLNHLILKCLAKNKEKRYQGTKEILAELEDVEKRMPSIAREIPESKTFTFEKLSASIGLKKLQILVLAFMTIIIIGVIIWQVLSQKGPESFQSQKISIAVLPFVDLSPQKDLEYLCDGMAEDLINRLTNIERLNVPARTSSFSFKGKGSDINEISEKLKVKNVLEGSIQRRENNLIVTVHLFNVEDGYLVFSEKYERDEENLSSLQEQIALAIIDKFKLRLFREEKAKLVKSYGEDHEARDLYWQGQWFLNKRGGAETIEKAIDYFKKAIEKDPQFPLPYVGNAYALATLGTFCFYAPKKTHPEAKNWIKKALEIDESLCEAHVLAGRIYARYDRNWTAAEKALRRALEIKPNSAEAHYTFSYNLLIQGLFEEAIKEARIALELDPLSLSINAGVGVIYIWNRQYDEAVKQLRVAVEMDPSSPYGHIWLGNAYSMNGMHKEAIVEFQKVLAVAKDLQYALGHLGWAYARSGQTENALEILDRLNELSRESFVSPWFRGAIHMELGNIDQAFDYFELAISEREPLFVITIKGPWYDKVRSDSRFKALLKKMNLE